MVVPFGGFVLWSEAKDEVVIRLTPRLLSDDMISPKQAAIVDLGVGANSSKKPFNK
jgi:hypothetical protein